MTIKKAWLILGIVTAVTAAVAIIKGKLAATFLGPEGVGIFSQTNVFIVFATTICTIGLGQGIVKHLAERNEEDIEGITRREVIATSLALQLILTVVMVLAVLIFQSVIAKWVFGEVQADYYVVIAAGAIPLMLLFLNLGYFLQGSSEITRFSLASILNVIVGLGAFIWLITAYGLDGAVLSLLVSAGISVFIFAWFSRRKFLTVWNERKINGVGRMFSSGVAKILLLYGIVTFIGGFLETFNALVLRSWIINKAGAAENGIYQAVLSLSGQYIGFFALFNTTYLFPKLSSIRDSGELGIEINKALRLGAFCLTPLLAIILVFREELILLFFTPAFLSAAGIVVWQILGDFIKISSWFITASLLPTGRLREYVILTIIYSGMSLTLSLAFLYRWNTVGIAIAHFWTYAVFFVLVVAVQRRIIGFRFSPQSIRLLALSAATLLFAAFFRHDSTFDYVLKVVVLVVWGVYATWEMRLNIKSLLSNQAAKIRGSWFS